MLCLLLPAVLPCLACSMLCMLLLLLLCCPAWPAPCCACCCCQLHCLPRYKLSQLQATLYCLTGFMLCNNYVACHKLKPVLWYLAKRTDRDSKHWDHWCELQPAVAC